MRAEYDHRNNRVVSIEMDDGRVVATHSPRVLGAPTQWVPVKVIYPPGYDQRFINLLHADKVEYRYAERGNTVEVHYPEADFSPDAMRTSLRETLNSRVHLELGATDWYFIRKLERDEPVPAEILNEREAIRNRWAALDAELDATSDDEIASFDISLIENVDQRKSAPPPPSEPPRGADGKQWVTNASAPGDEGSPVRHAEPDEQLNPADPASAGRNSVGEARPGKVPTGFAWDVTRSKE